MRQVTRPDVAARNQLRARTLKERFLKKIAPAQNCCWQWSDALNSTTGYGKIGAGGVGGKTLLAHRVAYELFVGPIPEGLQIDHLCRNRACVNPAHLEPVTVRTNLLRGPTTRAAMNLAKTHCPQGHPYDEANTYHKPGGRRVCRQCRTASDRQRRSRNKVTA